jgi:hypothetical protein
MLQVGVTGIDRYTDIGRHFCGLELPKRLSGHFFVYNISMQNAERSTFSDFMKNGNIMIQCSQEFPTPNSRTRETTEAHLIIDILEYQTSEM